MSRPRQAGEEQTLHLPRILCLHGGGVTGDIFRTQSRTIISLLSPYFRFVFADGPFLTDAGPGIHPVYSAYGPFRRWLRWLPTHAEVDAESVVEEIEYQIEAAMLQDDALGATGDWVGMMGFSQGAKLCASLLLEWQERRAPKERESWAERYGDGDAGEEPAAAGAGAVWAPAWRFGILLAGRAPLASLSRRTAHPALVTAADVSEGFDFGGATPDKLLRVPTVHVHGFKDEGLELHRTLLRRYCDPAATTLVEWDGTHRVPVKRADAEKVVAAVLEVAERAGVISG